MIYDLNNRIVIREDGDKVLTLIYIHIHTDETNSIQRRSNEAYESSSLWGKGKSIYSILFTGRFSCNKRLILLTSYH